MYDSTKNLDTAEPVLAVESEKLNDKPDITIVALPEPCYTMKTSNEISKKFISVSDNIGLEESNIKKSELLGWLRALNWVSGYHD